MLPSAGPHYSMGVDIGNLYDRKPEEYYLSRPLPIPDGARPGRVRWEASGPPGTGVKLQIRSATSREGLKTAVWRGPSGERAYFDAPGASLAAAASDARWLQYRIVFYGLGVGSSSVVRSVEVECIR